MKQISELEVGDEVLVIPSYRNIEQIRGGGPGRVTKVARVWLTVATSKYYEEKYRRDTGYGSGDPAVDRITTPELLADERRRAELGHELRSAGVTVFGRFTTPQLEAILQIATAAG